MSSFSFENLTANGSTSAVEVPAQSNGYMIVGQAGSADLGGGNVQLELSFDGGTNWYDYGSAVSAAGGHVAVPFLESGYQMRGTLASATTPDIDVAFVVEDNRVDPQRGENILYTETLTADGTTTVVDVPAGCEATVFVGGSGGSDFGTGTAVVQASYDAGTSQTQIGAALTASGSSTVPTENRAYELTVNLAGSSSPDLDVQVVVQKRRS